MTGYICMAVFRPNEARLAEQIHSIVRQSLEDWICLIGLDGPDEAAAGVLELLCGSDDRFRVFHFSDRRGHYRNFERIVSLVPETASWVALSDQDDVWYEHKLEILVPLLAHAALAQGNARIVDERGGGQVDSRVTSRVTSSRLFPLILDNQVTGSFAVMRREALSRALPFPEPTDTAYHDHWLAICAHLSGGVVTVREALQDYVQHSENVIGEETSVRLVDRLRHLREISGGRSPLATADYLARHRWMWRVRMARLALERFPTIPPPDRAALGVFAGGQLSFGLARSTAVSVWHRDAPLLRALALVAGAGWESLRARSGGLT